MVQALPSISLCMIVKNEERRLAECLQSALPVVSEMIVVDTGSSDRSVDIAESLGAQVYHHAWEGDFSTARNYSLSYAKGEWILILDGDETLDLATIDLFKQLNYADSNIEAFSFQIVNFTTDLALKTEASYLNQVRLFRNVAWHRYDGCVHNQLMNIKAQLPLNQAQSSIQVLHYGYTPEVWAAQNKDARIELHERAVREDPNNFFIRYNYGNHLKILKRYDEALEQFMLAIPPRALFEGRSEEACLELPEFIWGTSACFLGAFCANQIGAHEVAIELTKEALSRRPKLIDARVRGAEAYLALGQFTEAINLLEAGLLDDQVDVIKQKALYIDAPYRFGRGLFLNQERARATASFCSLLPQCRDLTVFTHLCLCACELALPVLWRYARYRGDLFDHADPDWPIVDQSIAFAEAHKVNVPFPKVSVLVREYELMSEHEMNAEQGLGMRWIQHLNKGLEAFNQFAQHSVEFNLQERLSLYSELELQQHQELNGLWLTLDMTSFGARLSLLEYEFGQIKQTLYRAPERFLPLDIASPQESAALLLAQVMYLLTQS